MSQRNSTETISVKLAKLNELVAWFENDSFELEKAIDKFAEAETLAKEIEQDLAKFKNDINVLKKDFSKE